MIINEETILEKGIHSGFTWYVCNNGHGYRNGYVFVPCEYSLPKDINCHGGITFSHLDKETSEFWLGFDCGHGHDLVDLSLEMDNEERKVAEIKVKFEEIMKQKIPNMSIKDNEYVKKECNNIIEQIIKENNAY